MRTIFILLWLVGFAMFLSGLLVFAKTLDLLVTPIEMLGGMLLVTIGLVLMFGSWITLDAIKIDNQG